MGTTTTNRYVLPVGALGVAAAAVLVALGQGGAEAKGKDYRSTCDNGHRVYVAAGDIEVVRDDETCPPGKPKPPGPTGTPSTTEPHPTQTPKPPTGTFPPTSNPPLPTTAPAEED